MDINIVDTNLTDFSYLTAFFSALIYHITKEKAKVLHYYGRKSVHFPSIILSVYECVCPV